MDCTLITGASGFIGKAFAKQLVKTDCLILTGRSEEKLNITKNQLLEVNSNATIYIFAADLTSVEDRRNLFKFIDDNSLKLKKLFNVAGADIQKAFIKYDQEKLIFQIRTNFEATLSVTLEFLKRKTENAEILTISSMCGCTPMPYFGVYSATKAALINFFNALRVELKNDKMKITTVLPGSVETRPDVIKDIKKQGLTGRLSKKTPEYVAEKSLEALKKNKRIFVPGLYNKIVYFFNKITPQTLAEIIVAKKFKIKEKDAF